MQKKKKHTTFFLNSTYFILNRKKINHTIVRFLYIRTRENKLGQMNS
jgi:hypothetical protein